MWSWGIAFPAIGLSVIAWGYLWLRGARPAVYRHLSLTEVEPFLRSWGTWLANRGMILVRHNDAEPTVQFRKHCHGRRGNALVFRYRNADDSRRSFELVCGAFQAAGIVSEFELTRHTRRPRALTVTLDLADVLMPAAAARLIRTVFEALDVHRHAEFLVWCERRMAPVPDRDDIPLLPPTVGWRTGFHSGFVLGRVARAIGLSRS
jgi:hypothetical protein